MYYVIVGLGPNSVEIPSLIFSSKRKAEDYLKENPLVDPLNFQNCNQYYTSYYGGCGECWKFIIREVEEGTPFVCFNLD